MKHLLGEPFEAVKELKFSEVRAMMEGGWETNIEICQKLEKVLKELVGYLADKEITPEEKQFLRNSVQSIEICF
eukprot:CAMPEP_0202964880 /NCGR_PEP_ID=MMETSP1396-20130829/9002_1 /ASSEMBLY_ACC=CAM_ASM_000872 /TAXON_ID= /ORGANISM="Pseudokeronopsis sp., Strain Brazil" /LENGTH=73 /DNA_ID=CAMNT_0049687363 /DNA_START=1663 /DNA_END=1884 /DNA_ORIENTATION=+